MVFGMPLTSFMSKIFGMMNPTLSSLSRAMRSRHAKSPAHHSSFLRYEYVPRRMPGKMPPQSQMSIKMIECSQEWWRAVHVRQLARYLQRLTAALC